MSKAMTSTGLWKDPETKNEFGNQNYHSQDGLGSTKILFSQSHTLALFISLLMKYQTDTYDYKSTLSSKCFCIPSLTSSSLFFLFLAFSICFNIFSSVTMADEVVLLDFWPSVFRMRVKIALAEKGIKYEYKE